MESEYTEQELYSELGHFIVEFEGLLQSAKDAIQSYLNDDGFSDTIPIEILIHDSTSSPLADYYQAISFHFLLKKHSSKNQADVEHVKKYVRSIANNLKEAGTLRNDIVHASWFLSSIYGKHNQLEANRIKITKNGLVMRKLVVKPSILENTSRMFGQLAYYIQDVTRIIASDELKAINDLETSALMAFSQINFVKERERLFQDDATYVADKLDNLELMKSMFKKESK